MTKNFIFNVSFVNDQDEIFIMYGVTDNRIFSKMVVDESGIVERSTWHGSKWVEFWSDPKEICDNYLKCGPNSYCDPYNAVNNIDSCGIHFILVRNEKEKSDEAKNVLIQRCHEFTIQRKLYK
ncbi:g-type lectin s-receptor-like serine/threonine-protein kinase [Fagus crenata]